MSITTEIERIKAAKAAIKDAINAKGGTLTDELLGAYADAVASLPSGGGGSSMDFFKCAAVYGPRQAKCVTVSGCPTAAVNGDYLPTEFHVEDYEGNKYTVYSNGTYYYYFNGMDNQWRIGIDYTSDSFLYCSWGTNMSSTSWNDPNWEPVEGMSSAESEVTIDLDVPKTWDGYKAVLSNGIYNFENELTTGLSWSDVKPEILNVYSADVTVKAEWLSQGYPADGVIFSAPLTSDVDIAEIGGTLNKNGSLSTGTLGNADCTVFNGGNITADFFYPINQKDFSIFVQFNISAMGNGGIVAFGGSSATSGLCIYNHAGSSSIRVTDGHSYPCTTNTWYSLLCVRKKGLLSVYLNKTFKETFDVNSYNLTNTVVYIADNGFNGGIRNILIYNRALSETEIEQLNNKFAI